MIQKETNSDAICGLKAKKPKIEILLFENILVTDEIGMNRPSTYCCHYKRHNGKSVPASIY
ncbi:MAG: hypothetical protein IPG38_09380 [Chitinophagaceae bacterium]|nr:hypothetical protein [Chitinophagaceae bacterium]